MNSFNEKDLFCPFCGVHSVNIINILGKTAIICNQCTTKVIFTQIPLKDRIKQMREKIPERQSAKT